MSLPSRFGMTSKKRALLAALVTGVLVAAFLQQRYGGAAPADAASHAHPETHPRPSWVDRIANAAPAMRPQQQQATLEQLVDQLIGTGKPAAAFAAYHLISDCMHFEKSGFIVYVGFPPQPHEMSSEEKAAETRICAGMTERMKTSRLDYLTIAAKNGVVGADISFLIEGPFGDPSALTTRPDDPLVLAWREQALGYLIARANEANIASLSVLHGGYVTHNPALDKEPVLALTAALALRKIYAQFDSALPR